MLPLPSVRPISLVPGGVPEPVSALDRVAILENDEPLVGLHSLHPRLHVRSQADGYPYLRQTAAGMLCYAVDLIPAGYDLVVISALRSLSRQEEIWRYHYDRNRQSHPCWPEHIVVRETNRYVAPPNRKAPPGHCTGGAVDVVLRKDGAFIDLVPPDLSDWRLGHTWCDRLSAEVRESRLLLAESMAAVGFSNCRDEYWHYSYGDSGWAVRTGEKTCCYGAVLPPTE